MAKIKTKIISAYDMMRMSKNEFQMLSDCLKYRTYRLLGVDWKRRVAISRNMMGDICFQYD